MRLSFQRPDGLTPTGPDFSVKVRRWQGEVSSEPQTQPPAEQPAVPLSRLPYCQPTTEPCPRLIAPGHPANLREVEGFAEGFNQIDRALAQSLSAGRDQLWILNSQLSGVRLPASTGQTGLSGRPVGPRLDLLEPTIRQLLATISPLTQPRSEAWPERTMALLITFHAANAEIAGKGLNNKTPAF